tara:strand:- start:725 stop:1567 length:843 start_codon:yes stop_codon:yes gene_type:complete
MSVGWFRVTRRFIFLSSAVVSMSLALLVSPAFAHDPIFLSADDRSPNEGPLLPDGTISFAVYGRLDHVSATQGFQARLDEGELLTLSLLIPARIPETQFETGVLPEVLIVRPDGSEFDLSPEVRVLFNEPYTNTQYLRLDEHDEIAQKGTYDFLIAGKSASRYVVSIGTIERFGTSVERYVRPLALGRASNPLGIWFASESREMQSVTTTQVPPTSASETTRMVEQAAASSSAQISESKNKPSSGAGKAVVKVGAGALALGVICWVVAYAARRTNRTKFL